MTTTQDRRRRRRLARADRAARRQELDGSGPVPHESAPHPNPGARGAWPLLGEVLVTGVLVALVGLPLVTLPTALAAGVRHLRRFAAAGDTSMTLFWRDVRRALPGGAAVGAAAVALVGLLALNVDLARSGYLPGGEIVEAVSWVGLAALATALLAAAGTWTPAAGWAGALRALPASVRRDVGGGLYLVATVGFVAVVTWVLPPLLVPALGCAALAVVAIPARPRPGARART